MKRFSFCRRVVGFNGERLRIYHRASFHFLSAFNHDAVAGFEAIFNNPIRPDLLADFDKLQAHGIRLAHNRDLIGALQLHHGALRHAQCIRYRMRLRANPTVLAGAQN